MKTSLIIISLLLFSNISKAQVQVGWSNDSTIFDLRVFSGSQMLGQSQSVNVSQGCPNATTDFHLTTFQLDTESPLFEETFSILLSAQASGRLVQLYRTGECSSNGLFAMVNGARLRNLAN